MGTRVRLYQVWGSRYISELRSEGWTNVNLAKNKKNPTKQEQKKHKQTEESILGTGNKTGAMVLQFVEKSSWEQGMVRLKLWVDHLKKSTEIEKPNI